jgi:hypothetical protein
MAVANGAIATAPGSKSSLDAGPLGSSLSSGLDAGPLGSSLSSGSGWSCSLICLKRVASCSTFFMAASTRQFCEYFSWYCLKCTASFGNIVLSSTCSSHSDAISSHSSLLSTSSILAPLTCAAKAAACLMRFTFCLSQWQQIFQRAMM